MLKSLLSANDIWCIEIKASECTEAYHVVRYLTHAVSEPGVTLRFLALLCSLNYKCCEFLWSYLTLNTEHIHMVKDYIPEELFQVPTQMYTNTGIHTYPPEINLQSSEWVGTREHKNSKLLLSLSPSCS